MKPLPALRALWAWAGAEHGRLRVRPAPLILTLAVGAAGGLLARAAGLPLALILGSLFLTATLALFGIRPLGLAMHLPPRLRTTVVPVIGVTTGSTFTPAVLSQIPDWWESLLALVLFVPLAHAMGYLIYRLGGMTSRAAFYGAAPGGFIESIELGRAAGVDEALLTVLQFLRLIGTIVTVPLIFLYLTGHAVGSAAGLTLGSSAPLSALDWLLLTSAGALGWWGAVRMHWPAPQMIGPMVLSALLHGSGLVQGQPPVWLITITQIILGTGLGARFLGTSPRSLMQAGRLALVATAASLSLAALFAVVMHGWVSQEIPAVFLAFAPGGLAEMSLIALSLNASVAYVTAHHVMRILLAVAGLRLGNRMLRDA